MKVSLTRRAVVSGLLAPAATVVVVLGSGQAAAVPAALSPKATPAYAEAVVKSAGDYWAPQLRAAGHPGWGFRYWISRGAESVTSPCGLSGDPDARPGAVPSAYCRGDNTVYLSSSWLFNHTTNNGTTPYGLANTIAHEVGHAVQAELGLLPNPDRVEPGELQADCFAGAWVGRQARTGQATAKDVNDAQRDVQNSGDYHPGSPGHHGTADERVAAWRAGLRGNSAACFR